MLVKKFVPPKFLFAVGEIVLSGILIATSSVYPSTNSTNGKFIAGCALIIVMTTIQIAFTFIGINIYNARINFQNMIFNAFALVLLVWFALDEWQQSNIWYIWGFLSIYPFFNELSGMISTIFHSKRILFQKYRAEQ